MAAAANVSLSMRSAFAAHAQVDAIAALPAAASLSSSSSDKSDAATLLAVAQSSLEGNEWGGIVSLYDANSAVSLCAFQLAAGVSALAWCGASDDVLALACDNGDVQLVQLTQLNGAYAFVPVSGVSSSSLSDDADAASPVCFGHDDVATSVSASLLERSQIATSSWDLTVKLWDITSMDKTLATLEGHTDLVWGVAMNPLAAHVLASASQDCTVQLWDARQPTDAVHALSVRCPALSLDWHPQRETVLSVGLDDGSVLTFDTRSPATALLDATPHDGPVHVLQYSRAQDDVLVSGGDDARVFVRSGAQPPQCVSASVGNGDAAEIARHRDYVRALAWVPTLSSDCSRATESLVTGCWDKTVRLWDVEQKS